MKRILLALLCTGLAAPAWSLSCIRPDIVRTFEEARDSDAGFWIVRGRIIADGPVATPEPDANGRYKDNAVAKTPAQFVGVGLRPNGEFADFKRDITLSVSCIAHWCGSPPLDTDVFAAIEVKDSGPELQVDACSSRVMPYSEDGEKRLLQCLSDGICTNG